MKLNEKISALVARVAEHRSYTIRTVVLTVIGMGGIVVLGNVLAQ